MQNFLLDILSFGAILSSVLVITSKNPVIAVIFLISVFVNVAGYLLVLGVGFIGISYVIVYCGAIAILFLFVIMMINIKLTDILETGSQYTKNLPLGVCVASFFFYELYTILPFTIAQAHDISIFSYIAGFITNLNNLFLSGFNNDPSLMSYLGAGHDIYVTNLPLTFQNNFIQLLQIESIGHSLYTYGAIWLFIASIILLLALLSPIMISSKKV
jgi:NADH-ubiquinone oxidoreductase chain 6